MSGEAPALALFAVLAVAAWIGVSGNGRSRRWIRNWPPPGTVDGDNEARRRGPSGGVEGLADTAMILELVAAMLEAGAGIGRALELVAASADPMYCQALRPVVAALAMGADWETAWGSTGVRPQGILDLQEALGFAALTGAPSSAILYAQAARLRRERFRAAEKRAATLGVKLVLPLGLCSLPAFICLGVVPVLLALLPSGA